MISSQENVIYCKTYTVYCHFTSSIWSADNSNAPSLSFIPADQDSSSTSGCRKAFFPSQNQKSFGCGHAANKRSLPGTHRCGQGVMCHRRRSGANRTEAQHPIDLLLGCVYSAQRLAPLFHYLCFLWGVILETMLAHKHPTVHTWHRLAHAPVASKTRPRGYQAWG